MLVILGGSSPWTVDLLPRLEASDVMLVGRDRVALDALRAFVQPRCTLNVHVSTEPVAALREATVVLCQARIGGWAGRQEDESGPARYGGHGDETLGLGGLRAAIRASRTLAAWARASGQAPVVMLSNPTDLLTRWWGHHSGGRAISACEVPTELLAGLPTGTRYLGVNHLGWAFTPDGRRVPTRALTSPASRSPTAPTAHNQRGRYLARLSTELRHTIVTKNQRAFDGLISLRRPRWYGQVVAPILGDLLNRRAFCGVLGLPNDGRLPALPPDLVVESVSSVHSPDYDLLPRQLVAGVTTLGRARERAWQTLKHPSEETLRAFLADDLWSSQVRYSPQLLSWVTDGR